MPFALSALASPRRADRSHPFVPPGRVKHRHRQPTHPLQPTSPSRFSCLLAFFVAINHHPFLLSPPLSRNHPPSSSLSSSFPTNNPTERPFNLQTLSPTALRPTAYSLQPPSPAGRSKNLLQNPRGLSKSLPHKAAPPKQSAPLPRSLTSHTPPGSSPELPQSCLTPHPSHVPPYFRNPAINEIYEAGKTEKPSPQATTLDIGRTTPLLTNSRIPTTSSPPRSFCHQYFCHAISQRNDPRSSSLFVAISASMSVHKRFLSLEPPTRIYKIAPVHPTETFFPSVQFFY